MTQDVLTFAAQKSAEGKKVALVTVTETFGSSPASPGQMMAVLADGYGAGTIGGGASEHRVIEIAAEAIQKGKTIFAFTIDHAENGMSCGGSMNGFGNVLGRRTNLCIFGGGHIAQSLARIAADTGFAVTVVEDRPEFAAYFSGARYVLCKPDEYETDDPLSGAEYAVICTRGHNTDAQALRYCLGKRLTYVGMIGSRQKVTEIMELLRAEGTAPKALDQVYAPIGLDIADSAPAEIAVAILSEILLVKNNGSLLHRKTRLD